MCSVPVTLPPSNWLSEIQNPVSEPVPPHPSPPASVKSDLPKAAGETQKPSPLIWEARSSGLQRAQLKGMLFHRSCVSGYSNGRFRGHERAWPSLPCAFVASLSVLFPTLAVPGAAQGEAQSRPSPSQRAPGRQGPAGTRRGRGRQSPFISSGVLKAAMSAVQGSSFFPLSFHFILFYFERRKRKKERCF